MSSGRRLLIAAVCAALVSGACGRPQPERPVLLVGVDGFEWSVLLPLVRSGQAPHLAALMERGRYGRLATIRPTFSPIIWTSIATGKPKEEHGIRGFVLKGEGSRRIYTSFDRRTKAFWNILSDAGRSVAVVGWWMTYPAEEVNGVMVAQVNTLDQARRVGGKNILKGGLLEGYDGQVYPEERLAPYLDLHRQVADELPQLTRGIFGEFAHPATPLTERLWLNTQWAFRSDATYLRIADELAGEGHDLLAVYLGGADVVAHRFWRFMEPELYEDRPSAEEIEDYGTLIEDYYRYVDTAVGRLVERMPPETTVLIVSDHGMHGVNFDQRFSGDTVPKSVRSGHHPKAPPGVIIAAGGPVVPGAGDPALAEAGELERIASIFDVTPSLLTILGVPVGADMKGRAREWLTGVPAASVATVATHDSEEWLLARTESDPNAVEAARDEERLEQLRALGYIN